MDPSSLRAQAENAPVLLPLPSTTPLFADNSPVGGRQIIAPAASAAPSVAADGKRPSPTDSQPAQTGFGIGLGGSAVGGDSKDGKSAPAAGSSLRVPGAAAGSSGSSGSTLVPPLSGSGSTEPEDTARLISGLGEAKSRKPVRFSPLFLPAAPFRPVLTFARCCRC